MGRDDLDTQALKAWRISSLLDLPGIHKAMETKDDGAICDFARLAAAAEADGWKAHARAIGELQRRAQYKSAAVERIAKDLEIGKSTAFELGLIDRKILLPRLREEGEAATFPIQEKRFYALACKLAPQVAKSPLAILKLAEDERAANSRYSTRLLKEQLGVKDEPDPTRAIAKCIERLSALEKKVRQRFARGAADPGEVLAKVEASVEVLRQLAEDLRLRAEETT